LETTNSSVSGLYGLLAMFFATELSPELLARLRSPDFREIFSELELDLGEEFYTRSSAELVEELAVEFTGLFIGPGTFISPHESVHHVREDGDYGKLWGADTVRVKKFIEAAGLNYQSDFGGMPDHIAAELEFMQKLEERYAQAMADNETELAKNLLLIKGRFLAEHLLAWAPGFFNKVIDKATLPFYREIAGLAKAFLEQEGESLDREAQNYAAA
jgi:TorA maturation chaperone TorD